MVFYYGFQTVLSFRKYFLLWIFLLGTPRTPTLFPNKPRSYLLSPKGSLWVSSLLPSFLDSETLALWPSTQIHRVPFYHLGGLLYGGTKGQ